MTSIKKNAETWMDDVDIMVRCWIAGSVCRHNFNTIRCGICMMEEIRKLFAKDKAVLIEERDRYNTALENIMKLYNNGKGTLVEALASVNQIASDALKDMK